MFTDLGALLAHLGTTDPAQAQQIAALLDSQGLPPPTGIMNLGNSTAAPAQASPPIDAGLGSLIPGVSSPGTTEAPQEEIGPWNTTVTPEAQAAAAQKKNNPWVDMAGAAGMKLAQPSLMPGPVTGVTGGVKAPEHIPINPAVINGIIQMLNHPHATGTPAGPSLGQLMR